MKNKIYKILTFIILFFAAAQFAGAQSLNLTAPKSTLGDYFQVTLSINTKNKSINTISGKIRVSADKLRITEVRYGNSIINLWVERPNLNALAGTITFAGGIPGGYNGSSGPILTFFAAARASGNASVTLEDVSVLLNDGFGTVVSDVTLGRLDLAVNLLPPAPKKTEPEKEPEEAPVLAPVILPDNVPPEDFTPVISRHPSVENNKYFVSFFAVDKDSGISRYEASEKPWPLFYLTSRFDWPWIQVESPYIAKHQYWPHKIIVRAYDQAGNYKDAEVSKPIHPVLAWIFVFLWTLIVFGSSYLYFFLKIYTKRKARKTVV